MSDINDQQGVSHPQNTPATPTELPTATTQTPGSPQPTNGLAVASLTIGLIAFLSGWIPIWGFVTGVAAVVLGSIGLKKSESGKGLAIAGIVTGGLALLTGIIFSALFLIAYIRIQTAADSFMNGSGTVSQPVKERQEQDEKALTAKKDFSKGETANFNGIEVKVNSVTRNFTSAGTDEKPEVGREFIAVNLTVKNATDAPRFFSSHKLKVEDGDHVSTIPHTQVDDPLRSASITEGASSTGNVVFDIEKEATDLKLTLEEILFLPDGIKRVKYSLDL